ncbi:unnamed protein product [Closterium sp. NIES-65]|nr:unnamed protein product [Closterium sp. NIES-65]CAI6011714.1 unnamed protein product [Closterium sp. NIES-65]
MSRMDRIPPQCYAPHCPELVVMDGVKRLKVSIYTHVPKPPAGGKRWAASPTRMTRGSYESYGSHPSPVLCPSLPGAGGDGRCEAVEVLVRGGAKVSGDAKRLVVVWRGFVRRRGTKPQAVLVLGGVKWSAAVQRGSERRLEQP